MFYFEQYRPFPIFLVMLLYLALVLVYQRVYFNNATLRIEKNIAGKIFTVLLCIYAVQDTDYFHYLNVLSELKRGYYTHVETVYCHVAEILDYDYSLFRLTVWGGAFVIFISVITRLQQNETLVLFFFITLFLLRFSYARVSLAMSLALLGYTFVIKPKTPRPLSITLGILITLSAIYFHQSALFLIPIFLLSLIRVNKFVLSVFFLCFPAVVYLIHSFSSNYMQYLQGDVSRVIYYLQADQNARGLSGLIRMILVNFPFYMYFYLYILCVKKDNFKHLEYYKKCILNATFLIILISTLFVFDYHVNTSVIYYRLLYFSILPLSVSLAILKTHRIYQKFIRYIVYMGFLASLYELTYSIYIASIYS